MVVKSVYLVASLVVGVIISVTFSGSAFGTKIQPVYSLKNLGDDYQDASGNSYKKLQVKCNTDSEPRYIHRIKGSQSWCVNGDASKCTEDRIEAATEACLMSPGSASAVAIETPVKTPVAAPSEAELKAQADRAKLEEEFMANQQKKIELRERQLELRKRELELRQEQEQLN